MIAKPETSARFWKATNSGGVRAAGLAVRGAGRSGRVTLGERLDRSIEWCTRWLHQQFPVTPGWCVTESGDPLDQLDGIEVARIRLRSAQPLLDTFRGHFRIVLQGKKRRQVNPVRTFTLD